MEKLQYKVIWGNVFDFPEKVAVALEEGWVPLGGVSLAHKSNIGPSHGFYLAQAFTKKD